MSVGSGTPVKRSSQSHNFSTNLKLRKVSYILMMFTVVLPYYWKYQAPLVQKQLYSLRHFFFPVGSSDTGLESWRGHSGKGGKAFLPGTRLQQLDSAGSLPQDDDCAYPPYNSWICKFEKQLYIIFCILYL